MVEHAVGRDKIPFLYIFPDNIALHPAKCDGALGDKLIIFKGQMGVRGIMDCGTRHIDLIPIRIFLIPENHPQLPVQVLQSFVFAFQIFAKRQRIAL